MEELIAILKKVSFFSSFNDDQLASMCDGLDLLSYHASEVIFEKGSLGDALYVIVSGKVRVHQGTHQFAILDSGDYFGEYSIFDQQERSATVTALEATQIIGISSERFSEWIQDDASFANTILKDLIQRHRILDTVQEELAASRTEVQLMKEELDALIKGARDPIFMIDGKGIIMQANPSACEVLENSDVIGRNFLLFLSEKSKERIESQLQQQEFTKGILKHWIELIGSEGTLTRHEGTFSKIEHKGNAVYVLIFRNIEDRLAAEQTIDKLTSEADYLKSELEQMTASNGIIAEAPSMKHVLSQIDHVAPTNATVLITGETGTGKELVARAIHQASDRAHQALIRINCGAIPENLIESELFGHIKGAFTGATQDRKGRFHLAHKGTLFLDEIGELPLALQPKLLRVIQEGEFEAVGSNKTEKVDVRIIAATHRDLLKNATEGSFREDLYYRLNVFPIHVPALRDRGEDVILITEQLLKNMTTTFGKQPIKLSMDVKDQLRAAPWKGNVRELQNVLERAVILSVNGTVNWEPLISMPVAEKGATSNMHQVIYTVKELQALERVNLIQALKKCHWKVSGPNGAAELLGMKPTTLQSRVKALDIKRPV